MHARLWPLGVSVEPAVGLFEFSNRCNLAESRLDELVRDISFSLSLVDRRRGTISI